MMVRTKLNQVFTEEEVRHIFLPRRGVVNSYVLSVCIPSTHMLMISPRPSFIFR